VRDRSLKEVPWRDVGGVEMKINRKPSGENLSNSQ